MGNCFKKTYSSGELLLSEYNEFSTIQLDSNTNNIARLNDKYTSLEKNINTLDNSFTTLDENTEINIKSLSDDIHHLHQEIIKVREEIENVQNSNKVLIKKLSLNNK
jgi:DNA repair exonuclease SbcCD ATPase subunit